MAAIGAEPRSIGNERGFDVLVSGFWTRPGYIQKVATREHAMPIQFRHDVDQVLKDAKAQQKPVLLDFSAAPM